MPEKTDVAYFIEHTARELDVACVIKYFLAARHGIQLEICSIVANLDETLSRWEPKVVALPYGTSVKDANLETIITRWSAARYINLSYEQVLGKTQRSFKAPKDSFARQYLVYTAWGDFFLDYLREHDVPLENIVVVGNPALALYTLPYRNYYGNTRAELAQLFGLSVERRWVFIPENYGWAFFKDHQVRDRIRRGFNPEDAFRYRDFAQNSLREVSNWWRQAASLDNIELIVRPRPAIPEEGFRQIFLDFAGNIPQHLHIIKHGTVREWNLASDLVFSSYSTTLLDAALAEKSVYMLTPYPIPEFLYSEWYDLTAAVSTFDDFASAIQADPLDANWNGLQTWVKQQMMSRGDAIVNLSALIAAIVQDRQRVASPIDIATTLQKPNIDQVYRKFRNISWNLWQSTLSLVGMQSEISWNPHEMDLIDVRGINERVNHWAKILTV